jgi:hypothetical protein
VFVQAIAVIDQSDEIRDGDHIGPLQRLLASGEHLVHNVVGMARRKEGELNAPEPSPVDEHAAKAQKPSVLVLLGTVVHLQPQCVRSPVLWDFRQFGVDVQESGGDVQVGRTLIDRQMIHVFPGVLGEVDDANGMERHAFIGSMAFGHRPQMGQPHTGGTVCGQMHVSVRVPLRLLHALTEGKTLQFHQPGMSHHPGLEVLVLLGVPAFGFPGSGLGANVTQTKPCLLGKLDMLEVLVHDGMVGADGGQGACSLLLLLEVLDAECVHVLVAEVHGNMDSATVRHLVPYLLEEGREEQDHPFLVGERLASRRGDMQGIAMDRKAHGVMPGGPVELVVADAIDGTEGSLAGRDAIDL